MKIFQLIQYDVEGNSHSLWAHKSKEQFKEDCEWIIKTHIEQLFKKEEEGYFARIATEEVIELIEENLPKLGYEYVKPNYYGLDWTSRAENVLADILEEDVLDKLIEHNKKT